MNKNIVLDLDGVIADIADGIENYLYEGVGKIDSEFYDYSSWLTTDTKDETALHLFSKKIFWKNLKPFEDAWYQVNYWFGAGFDIHIVTARRSEASVVMTEPWLDGWKINTLRPKFSRLNEKHLIIKDINPLFVVEDNPSEVIKLRENGINCYLRKAWYNEPYWADLPCIDNLYDLDI